MAAPCIQLQEGDTGDEDSVTEDTRLSSEEGGGEGSGHPPRQGGRNDSPRHIQSLGEKAVEAGRGGEGGEKEGGEVERETVISEAQALETVATKEPSSDENKDTKDPDIHEYVTAHTLTPSHPHTLTPSHPHIRDNIHTTTLWGAYNTVRVGLSKPVGVILPPLRGLFLLVLKARPGYFVGEHNEHPGVNRKTCRFG